MEHLRTSRLRIGATRWVLLSDATDPGRMVERCSVASWAEHRDQHLRRLTRYDREVQRGVDDLTEAVEPTQHLLLVAVHA